MQTAKVKDKRKALLEATLTLVNNNGFHDAPMAKIAKMAGVSAGTIYLYFSSKQDLINSLYLETKAHFSKFAFSNFKENSPVKLGFKKIWYNIANFEFKHVEEALFLTQCENTPMIDNEVKQKGLIHLQPLLNLWERGKEEGLIKQICPYLLYSYSIYPLAFLMTKQQRENYRLEDSTLEMAFECAWDSIRL
ncbi:MAG: TetR/AcrR family transcriptional regulator [Lutibacter sp.]